MNIEKLKQCGVNYKSGVERFSGNSALYEKFLLKFLDDQNFKCLKAAVEQNNPEDCFRYAHALKGVSGNLSLDSFYKQLSIFVEDLRAGRMDTANDTILTLDNIYKEIIDELTLCK